MKRDLGFRTNRHRAVRDSDGKPARRGGFARAARFPNSSVLFGNPLYPQEHTGWRPIQKANARFDYKSVGNVSPLSSIPLAICSGGGSGIRVDPPCSAKLCFATESEQGNQRKKTKCPTKGANSISFPTSFGYKSVGNVSPLFRFGSVCKARGAEFGKRGARSKPPWRPSRQLPFPS